MQWLVIFKRTVPVYENGQRVERAWRYVKCGQVVCASKADAEQLAKLARTSFNQSKQVNETSDDYHQGAYVACRVFTENGSVIMSPKDIEDIAECYTNWNDDKSFQTAAE